MTHGIVRSLRVVGAKPEELNDRGKFLVKDMEDRKAKTPDVGKLKDFPGGKE